MKKLILVLSATLFLFSCGNEAKSDKCAEDCKKEACSHGDKKGHKEGDKKESKLMEIGSENPALEAKLKDISGEEFHIEALGKTHGTLIIFSCNTCPFVVGNGEKSEGWENRYNEIAKMAGENEIGFALINSNEAKRDGVDSFDEMVAHAKEANYTNIKYMVDANHEVADAFNAKTTPHVYLFNVNNELVYTGAIDDNVDRKEEVKEHWLKDAMTALAAKKEITTPVTKHMGCSIKRVKK